MNRFAQVTARGSRIGAADLQVTLPLAQARALRLALLLAEYRGVTSICVRATGGEL